MKSKKAKEYIEAHQRDGALIYVFDAIKAIEIAEHEVKERAIGAFTAVSIMAIHPDHQEKWLQIFTKALE